jgi:hypothetical protein
MQTIQINNIPLLIISPPCRSPQNHLSCDLTARPWSRSMVGDAPSSIIIIISYHLICPPFLPDLRVVRLIHIIEVKFYRIFEFPKLLFEQIFRD